MYSAAHEEEKHSQPHGIISNTLVIIVGNGDGVVRDCSEAITGGVGIILWEWLGLRRTCWSKLINNIYLYTIYKCVICYHSFFMNVLIK